MRSPHYLWFSQQGSLTPDNRDFCGIAETHETTLCILADGATSSPKGGELAKALIFQLLESFLGLSHSPSYDTIIGLLEHAHTNLRRQYPADSASYIIALRGKDPFLTTLHAGDCRLGELTRQGTIQWLTLVHSLATAINNIEEDELRAHPNRHRLTRSFSGRRFSPPEINVFNLQERSSSLLLASDGFWAGLQENQQLRALKGLSFEREIPNDDVSCLLWEPQGDQQSAELLAIDNTAIETNDKNFLFLPLRAQLSAPSCLNVKRQRSQ